MSSPNGNSFKHKGMPRPFRCPVCGKDYAMDWALGNHVKNCKERN